VVRLGHAIPPRPARRDRPRARKCAVKGTDVELVVSLRGIESAHPKELQVTVPLLAAVDTDNVTSSFCCHVVFLANAEAARTWEAAHPGGTVLDLAAAYQLGRHAIAPLHEPLFKWSRR